MEAYRTYINYCRCKNIRFCLVVLKDCHTVRVGYLILFTFLLSTDSVNNEKINKGPENQINEWTRVKQMKYPSSHHSQAEENVSSSIDSNSALPVLPVV